jgi:hypothetical protein
MATNRQTVAAVPLLNTSTSTFRNNSRQNLRAGPARRAIRRISGERNSRIGCSRSVQIGNSIWHCICSRSAAPRNVHKRTYRGSFYRSANTNRVLPIRALFALDQYPEERCVLADAAERPGFTHAIDHADCAPKLNEKMGLRGGPRTSGSSGRLGAAGGSRGGP